VIDRAGRVLPSGQTSILAQVSLPWLNGLAAAPGGALYYTEDAAVHRIGMDGRSATIAEHVAPPGCIVLLQLQSPWSPTGVALFGNDVYVLEYLHTPGDNRRDWLPRVRRIATDGTSSIVAAITRP
jgi:hypothetical protein